MATYIQSYFTVIIIFSVSGEFINVVKKFDS